MADWMTRRAIRRQQVREKRAKTSGTWRQRVFARVFSWPTIIGLVFTASACVIALLGEATLGYSVGQRIDQPIYARVDVQVRDDVKTARDRLAAEAMTPSYFSPNQPALTSEPIRQELMVVYQTAADAETFEAFQKAMADQKLPAEEKTYSDIRSMTDEGGRERFRAWVDALPVETEHVVRGLGQETREPRSAADFIRVERSTSEGGTSAVDVGIAAVARQTNDRDLQASARAVAESFPFRSFRSTIEAVVFKRFKEQPTLIFNRQRTAAAMRAAAEATPVAFPMTKQGSVLVTPGLLTNEQHEWLRAERQAYLAFLDLKTDESRVEKRVLILRRTGMVILVAMLSIGLLTYVGLHQRRVLESFSGSFAFAVPVLIALAAARVLDLRWPDFPELILVPCLLMGSILAIAYPYRFAMGVVCIIAVMAATLVDGSLVLALSVLVGVVATVYQLDEIRSRTKLMAAGLFTAAGVMVASVGGGFWEGHDVGYVVKHASSAGGCAILPFFVVSAVLPWIERMFRVATSLTLLEWRDPTRPLLQLLAREAPGTYNHSLVLGTLAEAACERIGANGLLTQVGALYHDIGKIPKAPYFVENQQGQINRHDNLAPTMSLLIILGHVKDGIEMAREYTIPRVLHQFVEEHHGTTVVRYFHHMASEKQPQIATGRHDRDVPETEFRYGGPKPRSRESAVLMLCDGVEGAVRALPDPTPNRIEGVVHNIVNDRRSDGQFDDCDITLRELHLVEESLVKGLCSIYHGRVAYPKARKPAAEEPRPQEMAGPPTPTHADARVG